MKFEIKKSNEDKNIELCYLNEFNDLITIVYDNTDELIIDLSNIINKKFSLSVKLTDEQKLQRIKKYLPSKEEIEKVVNNFLKNRGL